MKFIRDDVSEYGNVYDVLKERGFIAQCSNEEEVREMLGKEKIAFYIGFDPTADSLHVGHLIQIITMMYMQKFGHIPIALIGAGTGMVGDPSGRSDMRQMMTEETIAEYGRKFVALFEKFIDFSDGKAICDNNANWLMKLNYVEFLRDVGRHFSVNNMLRAECFKQRLEQGLSFLEFNYMLMQAYDFMELSRKYDCRMQMGGSDQWSNILAGVELTRKKDDKSVYALTFELLTNSEGQKMGKTKAGALWLDPKKTSPYEFYQYWRNVEDADVRKCLCMLTFLPMKEIDELCGLKGEEINKAKEILAFEVTKLAHNEEEAVKAREGARAAFEDGQAMEHMPTTVVDKARFEGEGVGVVTLINELGLVASNSEGFRTIEQGGLVIAGEKVTDKKMMVTLDTFEDGKLLIQKGKKAFHVVKLADR